MQESKCRENAFCSSCNDELLETLRFIDAQGARRGGKFRDELRTCIAQIKSSPASWPRLYRQVRIRIMKKFGFGIYYEFDAENDEIMVGAFQHLKRKAGSWKRRFRQ